MTAKEYLTQAKKIERMIQNKTFEKMRWESIAKSITPHMSAEKVKSSGNGQSMAIAIEKCIEIENEIAEKICFLSDTLADITATIEQLKTDEYTVLHLVYIQEMSFADAAKSMGKSYRAITSIHGRALQSVQKIIDAKGM